jgi:hypothetical protein
MFLLKTLLKVLITLAFFCVKHGFEFSTSPQKRTSKKHFCPKIFAKIIFDCKNSVKRGDVAKLWRGFVWEKEILP